MRVSGHIPRGLSVPAAVQLGFDEVNHAAFLFSTFYQDSLYIPTMRAYSLVASTVAPNINVDGPEMTGLIDVLKQHHTVIDGTFSVWISSAGTGIAQAVGAGVPSDVQKADANYRGSSGASTTPASRSCRGRTIRPARRTTRSSRCTRRRASRPRSSFRWRRSSRRA